MPIPPYGADRQGSCAVLEKAGVHKKGGHGFRPPNGFPKAGVEIPQRMGGGLHCHRLGTRMCIVLTLPVTEEGGCPGS